MGRLLISLFLTLCLLAGSALAGSGETLEEAEALFVKKEYGKSARMAEKLLKEQPDNLRAGLVLAESLNENRKYLKAIDVYKDLIRQFPDNMDLVFNLGIVYNNAEYHANAVTAYEQVVTVQPDNLKARHRLGVSHALCMDLSKAYEVYRFLKKRDEKLANDLLEYIQSNR